MNRKNTNYPTWSLTAGWFLRKNTNHQIFPEVVPCKEATIWGCFKGQKFVWQILKALDWLVLLNRKVNFNEVLSILLLWKRLNNSLLLSLNRISHNLMSCWNKLFLKLPYVFNKGIRNGLGFEVWVVAWPLCSHYFAA